MASAFATGAGLFPARFRFRKRASNFLTAASAVAICLARPGLSAALAKLLEPALSGSQLVGEFLFGGRVVLLAASAAGGNGLHSVGS